MSQGILFSNGTLTRWENRMVTYGRLYGGLVQRNANTFQGKPYGLENVGLPSIYYDGAWVFAQIGAYTGNRTWYTYADRASDIFQQYVAYNQGDISGHLVFTDGLVERWQRTGNTAARNALLTLARNNFWTSSSSAYNALAPLQFSRDVAYGIETLVNAEAVGYSNRQQLNRLVGIAFTHINQWFGSKTAPFVKSFMVGLTANALIDYHRLTGNQNVVSQLTFALDSLWNLNWDAQNQWFNYADRTPPGEGNVSDSADLNLLIAPAYEWLYQQTGQARFGTRGEAIFSAGVNNAYLGSAKQFNQNYRLSFNYTNLYSQRQRASFSQTSPTQAGLLLNRWGTYGNDNLLGTNANERLVGFAGVDSLTGGGGADIFFLGNQDGSFYTDKMYRDYAQILDLRIGQDALLLSGSISDYTFKVKGNDTWIYQGTDLVANVHDTAGQNLTSSLRFV